MPANMWTPKTGTFLCSWRMIPITKKYMANRTPGCTYDQNSPRNEPL